MIDPAKVKAFWDARAEKLGELDYDSIANLEEDPEYLALKTKAETARVFGLVGPVEGLSILDLGAGVGQWSFRFAERGARSVTAVEYSGPLAEIGRSEAVRRGLASVRFFVSSAERFETETTFDLVFISGLFVYLNDDQAEQLLDRLPGFCGNDTRVLLRDGTGLETRHEIDDRPSERLGVRYSATYRTADQYERLFAARGFVLREHSNMFEEGHPLNKFPETRLRVYLFERGQTCP